MNELLSVEEAIRILSKFARLNERVEALGRMLSGDCLEDAAEIVSQLPDGVIPSGLMDKLVDPCRRNDALLLAVLEHSNCPENLFLSERFFPSQCRSYYGGSIAEYLAIALRHRNFPVDRLREFALSFGSEAKANVARNPGCPGSLMWEILEDGSVEVRVSIAGNPRCPVDIIRRLAVDRSESVRILLAGNPNLPEDLFDHFSRDRSPLVRRTLAKRNDLPPSIVDILAKDKSLCVRMAVYERDDCPESIRQSLLPECVRSVLSRDQDNAGGRKNGSKDQRGVLVPDEWTEVFSTEVDAERAYWMITKTGERACFYRYALAVNPSTPKEILMQLVAKKDKLLHQLVLDNPNSDDEVCDFLAKKMLLTD